MNKEPRFVVWVGENVCIDYTKQVRELIRWEIALAIASLGPMPAEPLPPDELDEELYPRSLRYP